MHDEFLRSLTLQLAGELLENAGELTLNDDFFSVGGDSIMAIYLVGRLARATGLPLRAAMLIDNPVLADFVARVERVRDDESAPIIVPGTALASVLDRVEPKHAR